MWVTPLTEDHNATTALTKTTDGTDTAVSGCVALDMGENTIKIIVTALDGENVRTYTLTITRSSSADADLRDLRLIDSNAANLLANFASATQTYTLTVPNTTTDTMVTAIAYELAYIEMNIEGVDAATSGTGTISSPLGLEEAGEAKQIAIMVTSEDQSTTKGYSVSITRAVADDANAALASIRLSADNNDDGNYDTHLLTLTSPDGGSGTNYSASIEGEAGLAVRVSPVAADGGATISIEGGTAAARPNFDTTLNADLDTPRTVSIQVTSGNGGVETYSLNIIRVAEDDTDAELTDLSVLSGVLTPSFSGAQEDYQVDGVGADLILTLNAKPGQQIMVNDQTLMSNVGRSFDLGYGSNTIDIVVTAADGVTTKGYTVTAVRPVVLGDLELIGIPRNFPYEFDPLVSEYEAEIDEFTEIFSLRPILPAGNEDIEYMIFEEGRELTQDYGAASITLEVREIKIITIALQAPNGTTNSYAVRVTRVASKNADLLTLNMSSDGSVFADFASRLRSTTDTNYVYRIANPLIGDRIAYTIRLRAEVVHYAASVPEFTIGSDAGGGLLSDDRIIDTDIFVNDGETKQIKIKVLAQNLETSKTYTLTIMRDQSPDARIGRMEAVLGYFTPEFNFDPSTRAQRLNYHVELLSRAERTTLTIIAANMNASLQLYQHDNLLGSSDNGRLSHQISLDAGTFTSRSITVTSQDGSNSLDYTLTIARATPMDIDTLGLRLEMDDITPLSQIASLVDPFATEYYGEALDRDIRTTTANASVTISDVSVQRIQVNDDGIDYLAGGGGTPIDLVAGANPIVISEPIELAGAGTRIDIVLRRPDNTHDGYTEASHIVNIKGIGIRLRIKVFLEGPLQ